MSEPDFAPDPGFALLGLFDSALPQVYGYLLPRCGSTSLAEDLTAESFLAAVSALRRPEAPALSIPWLIGVARHKLVDHWRRQEREERNLRLAHDAEGETDDPWDEHLDAMRAREVLASLGPHHRVALTLRYADGLPVPEVAEHLGRTVHATEALLVRARRAFRAHYTKTEEAAMSDVFDSLGIRVDPIDPDPAFAAGLRRRLEDALLSTPPTRGGTDMSEAAMSETAVHESDTFTVTDTGDDAVWPPALTPYISVRGARQAIAWYTDVFAARLRGGMYEGPDGSIGHAELAIGDAVLMISDPWPEGGVEAPVPGAADSHSLHLQVDDVDATVRRAADQGAEVVRPPADEPYGRVATLHDPFGHRWMLNQPPPSATRVAHGDIGYVTLSTPDDEKAKAFYGAVLGWQFTPGRVPRGWNIEGRTPMMGLHGDPQGAAGAVLVYRVNDIAGAVERVRSAGGDAADPQPQPYGLLADCTDDQGTPFNLWQPTD